MQGLGNKITQAEQQSHQAQLEGFKPAVLPCKREKSAPKSTPTDCC
jgi:hypothetical protein